MATLGQGGAVTAFKKTSDNIRKRRPWQLSQRQKDPRRLLGVMAGNSNAAETTVKTLGQKGRLKL